MKRLIGGIVILSLLFSSCRDITADHEGADAEMMAHMHHTMNKKVDLDDDIPVFQPAEQTYNNHIDILSSENIYIRYSTSLKNKNAVIAFYQKELPILHWRVIPHKSSKEKIAIKKGDRYGSIRFFELKESDSTTFAYSINLVRPKKSLSKEPHRSHGSQ